MQYKHLLPDLYEFIGDAFKWRATVGSILPESLEEETLQAIHQSEVAEYMHAVKQLGKQSTPPENSASKGGYIKRIAGSERAVSRFDISKELADVLWTGAFISHRNSTISEWLEWGLESFQFDSDHLQHLDPLVLKAVSVSNWSKIIDVLKTPTTPNSRIPWISHLDKDRFRDICVLWNFPKAIIVGTDYQNPDKPQFNKVLKPKGYRSAEEVYRELKQKEGRDD